MSGPTRIRLLSLEEFIEFKTKYGKSRYDFLIRLYEEYNKWSGYPMGFELYRYDKKVKLHWDRYYYLMPDRVSYTFVLETEELADDLYILLHSLLS